MRLKQALLFSTLLYPVACKSATDAEADVCPQTYEFGNYGCSRVVALVERPITPLPAFYRLDVRALWAHTPGLVATLADIGVNPVFGPIPLTITLYDNAVVTGDTASVWLVARVLENVSPIVGVPLLIFAEDSVLHTVRFAQVGRTPRVDTVRLVLQRP